MRGISVCLLLAGLSQAVQVYINPPISLPSKLSARRASAALSRHLGLESSEYLNGQLYEEFSNQESFVGQGVHDALLLTVDEDSVKDVLPPSFKRTFTISSRLSSSALSTLVATYIERAYHTYSKIVSQPSQISGVHRLLDIFSIPSAASDSFLSETTALVDFLESEEAPSDRFAALELSGLAQIAQEYGRSSEQYKLAAKTIRTALTTALSKPFLHLALVSVPPSALSSISKRQEEGIYDPSQSPLPPPMSQLAAPIGASSCFTSQESCDNSTGGCSGHGECLQTNKAGRTCWVCSCMATQDSKGRTQEWAGESCEKKDVSGPFVLMVGTVVTLILLVGGSIALLSGVGDQELPSTLTGSAVGASSKRD